MPLLFCISSRLYVGGINTFGGVGTSSASKFDNVCILVVFRGLLYFISLTVIINLDKY